MTPLADFTWRGLERTVSHKFTCGHCSSVVSTEHGYLFGSMPLIRVCPGCKQPTFFLKHKEQIPSPLPARSIQKMPDNIGRLYQEARIAISSRAYTGAVLVLRVLLLHVAADRGMKDVGKASFRGCVSFLVTEGYVGKREVGRVDQVRALGNDANHELTEITEDDATRALSFMEHLLLGLYEYQEGSPSP